ncbi:Basal-body rod modification protein FlgD [Sulfidibacter corallicola]
MRAGSNHLGEHIMETSSVPSLNGAYGITGNPVANNEITEETFLQLLTVQLQHQDPLQPASDLEFIQQMATFASLEQQRITNDNLEVLQVYQGSINNSNALGIVGKDVKIFDGSVTHEEGDVHTFYFQDDSEAVRAHLEVRDEAGDIVYTTQLPAGQDGEQRFLWNGRDDDGNVLPAGKYEATIRLENADDEYFQTPVFQTKRINGVSYENGTIMVLVDGDRLPIEQVVEVYEPGYAGTNTAEGPEDGGGEEATSDPDFKTNWPFTVIAGGR